jgi:hypothetical protein
MSNDLKINRDKQGKVKCGPNTVNLVAQHYGERRTETQFLEPPHYLCAAWFWADYLASEP